MRKDTIFITIFSIFSVILYSQSLESYDFDIREDGQKLPLALAGGMNLPQFSEVDLDHDGIKDLFVFDKEGNALSAFKNLGVVGAIQYEYAPELLVHFPKLRKWSLMMDYNQDGAPDIFAYPSQLGIAGIEVHKGHWEGNRLAFEKLSFGQAFDVLYYPSSTGNMVNLYVSSIDIPAVVDVDNDGDTDILTFASNGGYVLYFRNFSQEQGYGADTLIFQNVDQCWGKFYESGLSTAVTLSSDPNTCAENYQGGSSGVGNRHVGSTLLALDIDEDGDKELFLGDVSYNNVVMLTNTGTPQKAYMTAQDTLFPSNSPVDIPLFPAIFAADIDNDGDKDLISAPNDESFSITKDNAWLYKNNGANASPQFDFVQTHFLGGQMLDLGKGAHPALADVDGDGLLDMVVGNETFFHEDGTLESHLFLYKNIGNAWQPKFELVDDDYLGLQAQSSDYWNLTPSFGDLDGDGDLDLLVGEFLGRMYYFENLAGAGQAMNFAAPIFPFKNMDVGIGAAPFIVDADGDGLMDILIGERNGNVNFIKNIGSVGSPDFNSNHEASPNNPFWGGIDTRILGGTAGYSVPRMWKENGVFRLFCGSESGQIFEYTDIEANLNGNFTKVTEDFGELRTGARTYPAFWDLNHDGLRELIIGNQRGGLNAFHTDLPQPVGLQAPKKHAKLLTIWPNPTNNQFTMNFGSQKKGELFLLDGNGVEVLRQKVISGVPLRENALPSGVYMAKVVLEEDVFVGHLVIFKR